MPPQREAEEDLWVWDLERGRMERRSFSPGTDFGAVWSPDGSTLFYASRVDAVRSDIFRLLADGTGGPVRLTDQSNALMVTSMTPEGDRLIALEGAHSSDATAIVQIEASGRGEPQPLPSRRLQSWRRPRPLARWALAGVRVERSGNNAGVRASVPGARLRALAGLDRGGKPAAVVARRQGDLLSRSRRAIAGGGGGEAEEAASSSARPSWWSRPHTSRPTSVGLTMSHPTGAASWWSRPSSRKKARRAPSAGSCWCRTGSTSCGAWRRLAHTEPEEVRIRGPTFRRPLTAFHPVLDLRATNRSGTARFTRRRTVGS